MEVEACRKTEQIAEGSVPERAEKPKAISEKIEIEEPRRQKNSPILTSVMKPNV